jgi:hypothetical protein
MVESTKASGCTANRTGKDEKCTLTERARKATGIKASLSKEVSIDLVILEPPAGWEQVQEVIKDEAEKGGKNEVDDVAEGGFGEFKQPKVT